MKKYNILHNIWFYHVKFLVFGTVNSSNIESASDRPDFRSKSAHDNNKAFHNIRYYLIAMKIPFNVNRVFVSLR